jgi:hypothetical protein
MDKIPDSAISFLRRRALLGVHDGRDHPLTRHYISECSHFHGRSGALVLFTRDAGHHSSGWMKNPDYERCWHLSLSFREPQDWALDRLVKVRTMVMLGAGFELAPFSLAKAKPWVEAMLYPHAALSWMEAPFSAQGKECDVRHWRVFCDPFWQPIKPRGEVYSTDFTEMGWRSWSEINQPMPSHVNAD